MTLVDARAFAEIAAIVHGGCEECVSEVVDVLNRRFPGFRWTMPKPWATDTTEESWTIAVEVAS